MRYENMFSVSWARIPNFHVTHLTKTPGNARYHKDYYLLQLKLILTCMDSVMSIKVCRLNKRFSTFVANIWS